MLVTIFIILATWIAGSFAFFGLLGFKRNASRKDLVKRI
jgi:hypothetical protein